MTKVRTILAEFCSPKQIQTINRLGLLKKEERESLPIPWRHRVHGREKRELVVSEMKTSLKPASKVTAKDKDKVVAAARYSIDSKMGECLLKCLVKQDQSLGSRLGNLKVEEKRLSRSHERARETFIKKSRTMNLEPLILVERPPSDQAIFTSTRETNEEATSLPGYMKPLRTRSKTPSNLHSIEAFVMEKRKKRNVWEEVLDEKQPSRFKSATMPAIRLSEEEVSVLKFGHILHKPTPTNIATRKPELKKGGTHREVDGRRSTSVFITELSIKDGSNADIPRFKPVAAIPRHTSSITAGSRKRNGIAKGVGNKLLSAPIDKYKSVHMKSSITKEKFFTDERKSPSLGSQGTKNATENDFLTVLLHDSQLNL